jgi:hypothetical protein
MVRPPLGLQSGLASGGRAAYRPDSRPGMAYNGPGRPQDAKVCPRLAVGTRAVYAVWAGRAGPASLHGQQIGRSKP